MGTMNESQPEVPLWARILLGTFIAFQVAGLIYGCLTYAPISSLP